MSELNTALVEIQRMTKVFKAFQEAENALKVLAGYEQNVMELKAHVASLHEQATRVQAETNKAEGNLLAVRADARKIIADAKAKADALIKKADAELVQRREKADAVFLDTRDRTAELEKNNAELRDSIEVKKVELDSLEAKIAKARAAINELAAGI
ncbi:hypothetical protein [Nitrosovibrio sp. Nv4]|uniref:hypothetical protein n=1 Tax=Nitrosovibrio sp. Nv4 TaxID=1945880 RepID=UPI000BC8FDB0|nr:hypothetical protein [Nitrosovibrio sp. Nv4]SOD41321.1 hypothetical protein SAMN06298226_1616 [Nitrosovibrio sp. Nv4]